MTSTTVPAAAPTTVRHHLPFTARTTTCCGRPGREFDRFDLVIDPANATCPGSVRDDAEAA